MKVYLVSAEADGAEGHHRPRGRSAGEEVQQPRAQEGDHRAAGGWSKRSVSVVNLYFVAVSHDSVVVIIMFFNGNKMKRMFKIII